MKVLRNKLTEKMLVASPLWLLEKRHHFKTRDAVREWVMDDVVFIHIPKSGGTSVAKASNRIESGHYTYKHLCNIRKSAPLGFYFVLRNPADRILSSYNYLKLLHHRFGSSPIPVVQKTSNVNEFLEKFLFEIDVEKHYFFKSVSAYMSGAPISQGWAINFNGLSENLSVFSRQILNKNIDIPHLNSSTSIEKSNGINEENLEKLKYIYKDDFALSASLKSQSYSMLSDLV